MTTDMLFNSVDRFPLICAGISKRYGENWVLRDIDLSIPRGSIYGLVGRNGAGKSTLMRVLLGLLSADSGSAGVLGEPALALGDATKARLGYVPQQFGALGWMKVGDMLAFVGARYPHWDSDFVRRSLERWSIVPSRTLAELSTGEQQYVALIRALAPRPELLVLDEPAAALDPVARRELLRELATRAGESGMTVLFSTHIVSDLERVASHVACLHRQHIVINAPMDDLKETHARVRLGAEAAARVPGRLPGELSRHRRDGGGLSLILTREAGAEWPSGIEALGGQPDSMDLEELFIEVTT
jgi:ABC-2 type transport system ATP-binding protein